MKYFFVVFLLVLSFNSISQDFVDKGYYLIDSLSFSNVSIDDSLLIAESMKGYHDSNDDSVKLNYISTLIDECVSEEVWPKYNRWLYNVIQTKLENKEGKHKNFHQEMLSETLNNFGYYYDQKGDVFKSLEFYHKSLAIKEQLEDKAGLAVLLNNLGYLYRNQGETIKALENYKKSLILFNEINDLDGSSIVLNNLAAIYKDQKNFKEALLYNLKALKIRQDLGNVNLIAASLNNIGSIYDGQKEYVKARRYYSQSLDISEKNNNKKGISISLLNLGKIDIEESKLVDAEARLARSLLLAREIESPQKIKDASIVLSQIYKDQGKDSQAFEMLSLYVLMKDSLSNKETQKAIAQEQAKYKYEKQQAIDNASYEKLLAIEQAEKESERVLKTSAVIVILLFLIFIIILFSRLRITRRQRNLIELQKQEEKEQKEIIKRSHKEITDSINYAERLQKAVLPSELDFKSLKKEGFIYYKPKGVVSGDFYWIEKLGDKFYIAVADCTGHGVPGALVTMVCSNALNRSVKEFGLLKPSEILDKTRELVIASFTASGDEVKDGMDISLYALDKEELVFSGANNPLWIIRQKDFLTEQDKLKPSTILNENVGIIEYKGDKQPIGAFDSMESFSEVKIKLYEGDCIYLFTDGFADQFGGEKDKKFRYKPFKELLISNYEKPMSEQREILSIAFDSWMGENEQVDDVCVLGIKI